jgi:hypothetical protein
MNVPDLFLHFRNYLAALTGRDDLPRGRLAMTDDVNYMLVWVAVQGLSPDQALASLKMGFSESAETRDAPGWPDFEKRHDYHDRIFMGQQPGNWLLLFGDLDDEAKDAFAQLARFGPTFLGYISRVGCFAEGHSYADGQEAWSIDYDYDNRETADALQVAGSLPPEMSSIIDQAYADEAEGRGSHIGIDVLFEIPGKMSKAICGFCPDEKPPEGFRWSMLQRIGGEPEPQPKPKGWFARLFG